MKALKILLVEDDPGHQYLMMRVLCDARPGVEVEVASDPEDYHELIIQESFDFAILDFHLTAQCQADQLLHDLHHHQPDCPAIVISGSDRQDIVVRSLRSGSVDFVPKDDAVQSEILWERIDAALRQKRQELQDRRRLVRRADELASLAETDPLTGLANRRCVDQWLDESDRPVFDRRGQVSVILFDLDHFKGFNDTYGHRCGDEVLMHTARLVRDYLPDGGKAARWGGEEFIVILPGAGEARAVYWAESFRQRIADTPLIHKGEQLFITCSLGVVTEAGRDFNRDTIDRADMAMYLAKESGRNRVREWKHVEFNRRASETEGRGAQVLARWQEVLSTYWDSLGPAQLEHLTRHSEAVCAVALELGRHLAFSEEALIDLRIAGLLHDIGKLIIPEAILGKAGILNAAEHYLISLHSREGAEMSRKLGATERAAEWIRLHHQFYSERTEEEDPNAVRVTGANILNAADAFVTMISDRPYQAKRSISKALEEMKRESGTQFHPDVAGAAVDCLGHELLRGRNDLEQALSVQVPTSPEQWLIET